MALVSFEKLEKSYGSLKVVKAIDLEVADGEFAVLVGPSGSGKPTTLRMLAWLESITGGAIRIGGVVVNRPAPRHRDIAMVFQDYALYPLKSVCENMSFSLRVRNVDPAESRRRVHEAAEMLGITDYLDRKPGQLSGGQRQRVAMGRAIVRRPKVFLFDEPLSNLDAKLRGQVRTRESRSCTVTIGTAIIDVTHDQVEAMTLADRIVILKDGLIEQVGMPDEAYRQPRSVVRRRLRRLARDELSESAASRRRSGAARGRRLAARFDPAPAWAAGRGRHRHPARGLHAARPMARPAFKRRSRSWSRWARTRWCMRWRGEAMVTARMKPDLRPKVGDAIRLGFHRDRLHFFDAASGRSLNRNDVPSPIPGQRSCGPSQLSYREDRRP